MHRTAGGRKLARGVPAAQAGPLGRTPKKPAGEGPSLTAGGQAVRGRPWSWEPRPRPRSLRRKRPRAGGRRLEADFPDHSQQEASAQETGRPAAASLEETRGERGAWDTRVTRTSFRVAERPRAQSSPSASASGPAAEPGACAECSPAACPVRPQRGHACGAGLARTGRNHELAGCMRPTDHRSERPSAPARWLSSAPSSEESGPGRPE